MTPYMDRALVFREEVRHKVPAVVHVDNTGRLAVGHTGAVGEVLPAHPRVP